MGVDSIGEVHSTTILSNPSWAEMFRSASTYRPPLDPDPPASDPNPSPTDSQTHEHDPQRQALYVAVALAGLAFYVLLLYGLCRLLHDFLRPIQWAVLCSIPLREIQQALVSFWADRLAAGPTATLLAVPAGVFRLSAATACDLRSLVFQRRLPPPLRFRVLLRWLTSFAVVVLTYERLGGVAVFLLVVVLFFAAPKTASEPEPTLGRPSPGRRLKTLVAGGLIAGMLAGAALGGAFLSYKIVVESKDAVVIAKSHIKNSNYADIIGFRRWVEEHDVVGKVDKYTAMAYGAVLEQVDKLAAQYNLTDLAAELKHLVLSYCPPTSSSDSTTLVTCDWPPLPVTEKLNSLAALARNKDWEGMYLETRLVLEDLQRSRADLAGRAKRVLQNLVAGGRTVFGGGARVAISVALVVVSGAGELFRFASHSMVFVWVLYYLITAEGGGVTERAAAMLPASDAVRARCVEVINRAISSVLLATGKIAIFQGCLTWLLFRLCSVHFLYVSAVLAAASPLLPFLSSWLSTAPAAAQFAVDGNYFGAIIVSVVHHALMRFGVSAIQKNIPGYNEYLTGLSIIGGMALFPSKFEGAIMGPLIMTVIIAFRDLYLEFVLGEWCR